MSAAPYEKTIVASEDEDVRFGETLIDRATGDPVSDATFEVEYALSQEGSTVLTLAVGDGITWNDATGAVTFDLGRLEPGEYEHAARIKEISTGKYTLWFDGSVTIERGSFSS